MISPSPRVVVLGAGVAGLEAAFMLARRLQGRVDLHVVSDADRLLLRPDLVYLPFAAESSGSSLSVHDTLARGRINHVRGRAEAVDTEAGRVYLGDGRPVPYEHLVIATGAAAWPEAVPGLREHAMDIWDAAGMALLRERFLQLRGRAREGVAQRVLFVLPRHNRYALPLYEVALMLDTWLRRERAREPVELAFVTDEAGFAEAAGPRMHLVIEQEFAERSIAGRASESVVEVSSHEASFAGGSVESFDLLVTAPPHRAGARFEGLPVDEHGFVRVERASRQVVGHPELYAPGDAGDFPLKETFLALLQADAAADHLAAVIKGSRLEHPFDATSIQIIDMLDKAAFAQLRLETTGDQEHPLRRRSGEDDYKGGVSRSWRAAKRSFSSYLLTQFAGAHPFRSGPGWPLMDLGVRATAGVLSE